MIRRIGVGIVLMLILLAAPACRFERSGDDSADNTSTTGAEVLALDEETTTTVVETTTTTAAATAATVRTATTSRTAASPTRAPAPRAPAPPRPPSSPRCSASAADTFYGSTWTVNVSSTFPSSPVTIDLRWAGGSGNYSGYTDGAGSWSKTQRVQPSMRGQRINVTVTVGGVRCSTSFAAS